LLAHSDDADRQLEALRESQSGHQDEYIKNLHEKIAEQEDIIARQESVAEDNRVRSETQSKELNSLRPAAEKLLELEDQVKELTTENATLKRKANTLDNYQKKLEGLANVEKENALLRQQCDTYAENQKDYDHIHHRNETLMKSIEEYQSRFENYETEKMDEISRRKRLQEEIRRQEAQIESLNSRQLHDETFITSLQEQIRTNTSGALSSPSSPTRNGAAPMNLEEELERSEDVTPNYSLEISRLKAEIALLKSTSGGTTNLNLRKDLEEAIRVKKQLEERYQALNEDYALGQEQLNSIISNSTSEQLVPMINMLMSIGPIRIFNENYYRNDAMLQTRKLYLEANAELAAVKNQLIETQNELSSQNREILSARGDCKRYLLLYHSLNLNRFGPHFLLLYFAVNFFLWGLTLM
jgi:protein HOOK3